MKHILAWSIFIAVVPLLGLAEAATLRIERVTVVSPERAQPLRNATVVVRDGRIVAVAARPPPRVAASDQTIIDGRGLYLTPGLIDSHVHLTEIPGMTPQHEASDPAVARAARAQFPRSYLLYGYTTLVDLISTPQLMAQWNANETRPDTYFCGATPVIEGYGLGFTPPEARFKAYPYMLVQPGEESKVPSGVDPAAHTPAAVVARMKADGASCVKAFAENGFGPRTNLPMIRLETAQALVRAAHTAGLPVFMHANAADMQAFALEAGADIIAHGMWHWDEAPPAGGRRSDALTPGVQKILDEILERNVGWQPTIQVLYGERDLLDPDYLANPALTRVLPASLIEWYGTPKGRWFRDIIGANVPQGVDQWAAGRAFYSGFLAQVTNATSYLATRKAKSLFGTDTPSSPTYANPPGLNGFVEMQRLVAAGLTPADVFRAATLANAEALRWSAELGTVEAGKRANLLLMREDPTRSVKAYANIVKVIVGGRVLDAGDLAADRQARR
jgi:imidazolonepropionase-like amidohydrolase